MSKRKLAGKKKLVFGIVAFLAIVLIGELFTRVAFAVVVGPRVLSYGTSGYRDARAIPSEIMVKVGYTPPTPEAPIATYAKFAPHEVKFDRDERGERFSPGINSSGFRGAEFSVAKEPGIVRVVTLGASSTFGYHDRDDETYPHFLEQQLNESAAEGARFEVINLGIPHIDTDQIVALFIAEALRLEPDIVTLYAGSNDAGTGALHLVEQRSGFGGPYEAVRKRSLMVSFLDSYLWYSGKRRFYQEDLGNHLQGKVEKYLGNLSTIRDECRNRGIVFVAATQQASPELLAREERRGVSYAAEEALTQQRLSEDGLARRELAFLAHTELMRALRDWAAAEKVPLADVIGATDHDRSVLLSYVHLSAEGNRLVAGELARVIGGVFRPAAGDLARAADRAARDVN